MEFTEKELSAFREEVCKGASEAQFDLFICEARARDLRPGTHLFFQLRNVNEWDADIGAKVRKQRATWITKIDAFRLISQRSGKDAGRGKTRWIYLDDLKRPVVESTVPLPHPTLPNTPLEPYACVVPIYRSDYKEPIEVVCRFDAFAVTMKQNNQLVLTDMWQRRGPEQLEKCSEVASRRAAYPESLGSLYIAEEFKNEEEEKPTSVTPASVVPLPPSVPKVDQTPATPTDAPRPNEIGQITGHAATAQETHPLPTSVVTETKTSAKQAAIDPIGAAIKNAIDHPLEGTVVVPLTEKAIENLKSNFPDLKPASEIPPPEKKKRGPKSKESPVNGRDIASEGGITDADIANSGPAPEIVDQTPAAEAFVEALDPTPTQEEMKGFTARVRALTAKGIKSDYVKSRVLAVGGVEDTKQVTVRAWKQALDELERVTNEKPATELGTF